jgi:hypothetical protein
MCCQAFWWLMDNDIMVVEPFCLLSAGGSARNMPVCTFFVISAATNLSRMAPGAPALISAGYWLQAAIQVKLDKV